MENKEIKKCVVVRRNLINSEIAAGDEEEGNRTDVSKIELLKSVQSAFSMRGWTDFM